jgi:hypothetical protein
MKYTEESANKLGFFAWQPSTWPKAPVVYTDELGKTLKEIFEDSLLLEIRNVINDAPTLEHRGHVVALAILCAIDTLSSYAFTDINIEKCSKCNRGDGVGPNYQKYIERFFPNEYNPFAKRIYKLYRNSITHSWNLFEAGMSPGDNEIQEDRGVVVFGLLNFFKSMEISVEKFIQELEIDPALQQSALYRYTELKNTAKP